MWALSPTKHRLSQPLSPVILSEEKHKPGKKREVCVCSMTLSTWQIRWCCISCYLFFFFFKKKTSQNHQQLCFYLSGEKILSPWTNPLNSVWLLLVVCVTFIRIFGWSSDFVTSLQSNGTGFTKLSSSDGVGGKGMWGRNRSFLQMYCRRPAATRVAASQSFFSFRSLHKLGSTNSNISAEVK